MTAVAVATVVTDARTARLQRRIIGVLCPALAGLGGVAAAALTQGDHASAAVLGAGLLGPIVLWHRPALGVFALAIGATAVEQFQYAIGVTNLGDLTERLPLFTSLQGVGLSGVTVSPLELILLMTLIAWVLRAAADGWLRLPRSPLATAIYIFGGLVIIGLVLGLMRGGDYRIALWELRPWLYLVAFFVLASQLLTTRRSVDALLWGLVIGTGIQALQGAWLLLQTRNVIPRPEAILAHEEAFFFGVFLVITLGLWLFDMPGALRRTATALCPFVVVADLGNDRRTAWLIVGAVVPALLAAACVAVPQRRPIVRRVAVTLLMVTAVYVPAFWSDTGLAGQPARTVRSLVAPDWRDDQSNSYRRLEDANLGVNIRHSTPFGVGMGLPIDYSIPIVDISNIDSLITYVPHDGVLYVWMRFGVAGILAFWWMICMAILAACRSLRAADVRLKLLAATALCAVLAYLIQGYADLGLFWFRIAIVMGCVLGCLQAAAAAERSEARGHAGVTGGPS